MAGSPPVTAARSVPSPVRFNAAAARRVAIAAQGLAAPRPAMPGMRHLVAAVTQMGLLQMDSVNVLVRSHYVPLFSRLGPYDRSLLERAWGVGPRRLVEYWAHEASLVPRRPIDCCAGGCVAGERRAGAACNAWRPNNPSWSPPCWPRLPRTGR